jgi:hypothetical protein
VRVGSGRSDDQTRPYRARQRLPVPFPFRDLRRGPSAAHPLRGRCAALPPDAGWMLARAVGGVDGGCENVGRVGVNSAASSPLDAIETTEVVTTKIPLSSGGGRKKMMIFLSRCKHDLRNPQKLRISEGEEFYILRGDGNDLNTIFLLQSLFNVG